ncbi:MAG: thiamine phosphate synthase [Pseudomonadota bacterium]
MADDAPRLYLVTPERVDTAFASTLERVLASVPVACLRLDLATSDEAAWRQAANHLLPICHEADVALVIAEHYRLVQPLGLDGVHLTGSTPVRSVRKDLGGDAIVGAGAGTSKHKGMTLAEAGADYVSLGPVAETGQLGDGDLADPDLFAWWSEMIEVPVVAEGGVGAAQAQALASTADFMVPDRRLWDAPDPHAALAQIAAILA